MRACSGKSIAGHLPAGSHSLFEALISSSTLDHHAPICCCPHNGSRDPGLPREGTEAIPNRCFERVAELVTARPPLDIDQRVAIEPTEHDPVDATTPAGAAAEWDRGHRRAPRLEFLPDQLVRHQLVPSGPEPRLMRVRGLAS